MSTWRFRKTSQQRLVIRTIIACTLVFFIISQLFSSGLQLFTSFRASTAYQEDDFDPITLHKSWSTDHGGLGSLTFNRLRPEGRPPPAPGPRMNATFVTLARNADVWEIARSIRQVEDRFNRKHGYDWVFLSEKPFDATFKRVTSALISGTARYGLIEKEHWSFPEWIDQERAKNVRENMGSRGVIYGDSVSYRHMCRFESGFFFRHPLMMEYNYYWRVEPSVDLYCDISFDPFRFLAENKIKYSFVISLYEYLETIPSLWDAVQKFQENYPEHIVEDNSLNFLSDDEGVTYNLCHFWSNFEIADLNFFRSKAYEDYFEYLDIAGGFFYERWGDAPIHSIAAGLMLSRDEIHFFDEIAYRHNPFTHCPTDPLKRLELKCHCNPKDNFDWKGYSCTSRYFDMKGLERPEGYENQLD